MQSRQNGTANKPMRGASMKSQFQYKQDLVKLYLEVNARSVTYKELKTLTELIANRYDKDYDTVSTDLYLLDVAIDSAF